MSSARDPRILELKRLGLALDAASKHLLDEFEARARRRSPNAEVRADSPISGISPESSFAHHVAVGFTAHWFALTHCCSLIATIRSPSAREGGPGPSADAPSERP
jgi:hypothetical protein